MLRGTNILVGSHWEDILYAAHEMLAGKGSAGKIPEKWEGKAAERIVEVLLEVG